MDKIYDIAIIGAGPGGIASSVEAVLLGFKDVVVFEKSQNHSDTIRKYFKDNKRVDKDWKGIKVELRGNIHFTDGTKESTLDLFDTLVKNKDIKTYFNEEVFSVEKEDKNIFKITTVKEKSYYAKNIVISIGTMGKPNKPTYKIPPTLKQKANFNISQCTQNEKLLIVGGGDSAVEFAYYMAKQNSVTLAYRKESFSRVNPTNLHYLFDYVEKKLIDLRLSLDITKLEDNNGQFEVYFSNGKTELFDRIVYALGGSSPTDFLKRCSVLLDENNCPIVDENLRNNQEGIYLAGDIAKSNVGGSIALALNHGYTICEHIKSKNKP
ncbi:NAD(P)-binding domain-containing protein [Malaciobacter canalis]|uniref:NAD(P)-binding domain-containing protein n=1 Tax=Malaciobacter canalis TaxID=1912871 RepID=UPI00384B406B